MPDRAAIITGASSGIGLAIARMLGEEGHALTVAARRPDKLTAAADELRGAGFDVQEVAGNMADEDTIGRGHDPRRRRRGGGAVRAQDVTELRHPRDRPAAPRRNVVIFATNCRKLPTAKPFCGSVRLHILGRRPCREPHHRRGHRRRPPGETGAD